MDLSVDNDDDVIDKIDISDDVIKMADMDDESDETGTDTDSMLITDEHIVDKDDPQYENFEEPPVLQPAASLLTAHHQSTSSTCPVLSASAIASTASALTNTSLAALQLTSTNASMPVAPFKVVLQIN